jgi:hypothetical protein
MDVGAVVTVTTLVAMHPAGDVYRIVADPMVMPVTTPEPAPTKATEGCILTQVPPVIVADNVAVLPAQIAPAPLITGNGLTVIVRPTAQPPREYVMLPMPGARPVTIPVELLIDIAEPTDVQIPPGEGSASTTVAPTHTVTAPVIAAGVALTVTSVLTVQPATV